MPNRHESQVVPLRSAGQSDVHGAEGTRVAPTAEVAATSATERKSNSTRVQAKDRKKAPAWQGARRIRAEALASAFSARPGMIQRLADRHDVSPQFVASWASGEVAFYEEDILIGDEGDFAAYSAAIAQRKRGEARADARIAAWEAALAAPAKPESLHAAAASVAKEGGEAVAAVLDPNVSPERKLKEVREARRSVENLEELVGGRE